MKIKARIDRMVNTGNVKAIASVSLDGMFVVKNLKAMDGQKGLFVSMPQESFTNKDGQKKYSNTFFALTNSAKLALQESVLQAYQQQTSLAKADVGNRMTRLNLTKSRLTEQKTNFQNLKSQNEDIDLEEVIVGYSSAQLVYNASLTAASKVVQQTLLDFL